MIILIFSFLAFLGWIWFCYKDSPKPFYIDDPIRDNLNKITKTYLVDNSITQIAFAEAEEYITLEKSPEIQLNYSPKHKFKEPIVVMLRSGNLAIVIEYQVGHEFPLYGVINSKYNNKDMNWSWKLNGNGGYLKSNYNDIITFIGELD